MMIQNGGNTALSLADAGGGTSVAGGYAGDSNISEVLTIPSAGCYLLYVIDSWGDGICCTYGNGGLQITDADGNILGNGSDFGAEIGFAFEYTQAAPNADFSFQAADLNVLFTDNSTDATSWNWNFGDGNTSTEQNPIHTYDADGTYTVTLTVFNSAGQDDFSFDVTVTGTVNIENYANGFISVLPNPAVNNVSVNLADFNLDVNEVNLLNVNGQVIKTVNTVNNQNVTLDLVDVVEGIYLVNIVTTDGTITKRLQVTK